MTDIDQVPMFLNANTKSPPEIMWNLFLFVSQEWTQMCMSTWRLPRSEEIIFDLAVMWEGKNVGGEGADEV